MKRFIPSVIVIFPILLLGWWAYYPQKVAITEDALKNAQEEYIIYEPCLVTGFDWQITESTTGYEGYVFIEGELSNVHEIIKTEVASNSRFVLYGEFVGEKDFCGEGAYPVFQSPGWDIICPIQRISAWVPLAPKHWLTQMDFY